MPREKSLAQESPSTVRVHADTGFIGGDGPTRAEVYADKTDPGEVGLHVAFGYALEDDTSIYLDPVGAALLAQQLLTAAQGAQQ